MTWDDIGSRERERESEAWGAGRELSSGSASQAQEGERYSLLILQREDVPHQDSLFKLASTPSELSMNRGGHDDADHVENESELHQPEECPFEKDRIHFAPYSIVAFESEEKFTD